jgi:tRNA1(Val) A37 N6-methylase TrmN6
MSSPGGQHGPVSGFGESARASGPGKEAKARRLGQVFTPDPVADLMASLCIGDPEAVVFDPCIGEGALLLAAGRRLAALGNAEWHRQVRGLEVDPKALAVGRRRLAEAADVEPEAIRLTRGDFLELPPPSLGMPEGRLLDLELGGPAGESAVCDVALMNPPYTRQERLALETKARGGALSRRAGLHAHFWMHLARFVRPGGWLGAITPSTWLSAEYGRELRAFLLKHFRIRFVIGFERDVFPDATVEACVTILEKRVGCTGADATLPVRFLSLSAGAGWLPAASEAARRESDGGGPGYRVRVVPQVELVAEEGWNRWFLHPSTARAVRAIRSASAGRVPLEAVVRIRRGLTTGNNRVFFLDAERAARQGIEERYLWRVVRSPREIIGLDTESVAQPGLVLFPPGPDEGGSRAAEYLREQGVVTSAYLPTTPPEPAPLLFGYAVRARKAFFRNSAGLLASDNFFEVIPRRPEETSVLFALLNSVVAALHLEAHGRGQGRGLLKIQRYELAGLQLPDPARMDPVARRELEALGEELRQHPEEEGIRAALDYLVARLLGLDAVELRRAERELASARRVKSLSRGAVVKGREVEWTASPARPGQAERDAFHPAGEAVWGSGALRGAR